MYIHYRAFLLQWQMSQMKKYCAKYKQEKIKYIFPKKPSVERKMIFRHLLFDRKRKVLFCFIPKVNYYYDQCMIAT